MNYEELVKQIIDEKLSVDERFKTFIEKYWSELIDRPAAINHHHNFRGGLIRHIGEMLKFGLPLCKISDISEVSFVKVVLLHDFAKIKNYEIKEEGTIIYKDVPYPVEFWTMKKLASHGITLLDEEINALVMAEGGWSEYEKVQSGRLASLLHISDMWSAKVICPQMKIECPDCGSDMVLRNGPRGPFYGCKSYPGCRGIINVGEAELKPVENMGEDWEISAK